MLILFPLSPVTFAAEAMSDLFWLYGTGQVSSFEQFPRSTSREEAVSSLCWTQLNDVFWTPCAGVPPEVKVTSVKCDKLLMSI